MPHREPILGDLAAEWCSGSSRLPQSLFSTFVTTYKATWRAAWMLRAAISERPHLLD